jgi:para-aminobenzoate synthetase / 4-amino-4-deoxychorismate lyase
LIDQDRLISQDDLLDLLEQDGTVWLDSNGAGSEAGALVFAHPLKTISAPTLAEVREVFDVADEAIASGYYVAGYVAYEAGFAFEPQSFLAYSDRASETNLGYPLVWFGVYKSPIKVQDFDWPEGGRIEGLSGRENGSDYTDGVVRIRTLIGEGDVYQVNYTTRFEGRVSGTAPELFGSLRQKQPVQFGAYLRIPGLQVLSFSPELFFAVDNATIKAKPMKGTAMRGGTASLDDELKSWLVSDVKNRAENLMIVDLLRNDLSIVCEPGTVKVPELFEIETHPTVHQMTSTVTGTLQHGIGLKMLFKALFPCGSITGAPKIRAMRRIAELEESPRGLYCGSIGYAGPNDLASVAILGADDAPEAQLGKAVFSVAIRTATITQSNLVYGSGGGVVWDSDPDEEFEEALLKTSFMTESEKLPFRLFETMYWNGSIPWLKFHLDRLQGSAQEFGFLLDVEAVKDGLNARTKSMSANETARIRLSLAPDGLFSIATKPYLRPHVPVQIGLASGRVSSGYPLLRHKTTERNMYDRAQKEAASRSLYDVILSNERGELTEGSITNLFVKLAGEWFTPPLASGLLPGIGRRVFLLESGAQERPLTVEDVQKAEEIRVTNALIGSLKAIWNESHKPD